MQEWFTCPFDKDSVETREYFANVRDVTRDEQGQLNHWQNQLQKHCTSAKDSFQLPWHRTMGSTLYAMMLERRDLFVSWHNPNSGAFYLRIGCANCSSATGFYQPQNEVDELGFNPLVATVKELKANPAVQRAFRLFLATILERPDLALRRGRRR